MRRLIIPASCVSLFIVILLAFALGRPAYRAYKERRAVARAAGFIEKGDFSNAALSARQALALNSSNLHACRIMADLAEAAGSPNALQWRRLIAKLDPSPEARVQLAAAALKLEPPPCPTAAAALEGLPAQATNRSGYHVLAAELALKQNLPALAQSHFLAAQRLEPDNSLHRLNVAILSLASTNSDETLRARQTLEDLAGPPSTNAAAPLAPLALRWLTSDALRRRDIAAALAFSSRLVKDPRAEFADHLQHLDILLLLNANALASVLAPLQHRASTNAYSVQQLAAWMNRNRLASEATAWLTSLPQETRSTQPVPLAIAESFAAASKWTALQGYLQAGTWTNVDFLRLAWLSRADSQLGQSASAEAHWRLAIHGAADRLPALTALAQLASGWSMQKPLEDLLWRVISLAPRESWAASELHRLYAADANTRALLKLYSALRNSPAANPTVLNNFATASMLLNTNLDKAFLIANEIYRQRPDDPVIVSTYAFSLHLQGRTPEGLRVLEQVRADALREHPLALYYGLLLVANGQHAKAAPYLDSVLITNLLPEEKLLLETARDRTPKAPRSGF